MRVLYVAYWGALEPLGQSLVLPAILDLAARGVEFTLVTFEKPGDLADREAVDRTRQSLHAARVRWLPRVYHKRPQGPAKAWDLAVGIASGLLETLRGRFDLIHARTFVGGAMGWGVAAATRTPFVYHNEGFYPDEQLDGGFWIAGSWRYRVAKRLEGWLYRDASAVVVLSSRAAVEVRGLPGGDGKPIVVVPSAVDLEAFRPSDAVPDPGGDTLRLVYVGSVGGRYRLDQLARFCVAARQVFGRVRLRLLSPADRLHVREVLAGESLREEEWSMTSVPHLAVPAEIVRHQAGLSFLGQGGSEHGGSPTKIGEYWACGLPVITTGNIGDVDEIIRELRVGVVVAADDAKSHERAAVELRTLLSDPGLAERCRVAAERYYSLEAACGRLLDLYRTVSRRRHEGTP